MARKKTPEIDICRIRTDRLRDMTPLQLFRAQKRVGVPYMMPKREQTPSNPRYLLARFIAALQGLKPMMTPWPPVKAAEGYSKWHRTAHGTEPDTASPETLQRVTENVDKYERRIWDLQQKRGCKIASDDAPARDYLREGGSHARADREIRRKPRARVKVR